MLSRQVKIAVVVSIAACFIALHSVDESWFDELDSVVADTLARTPLSFLATSLGTHSKEAHPSRRLGRGQSNHSDVWALIVSTSRFFHNYRHTANALTFYRMCKDNGIPDDHIILMLGDHVACDPRNPIPATIFNNRNRKKNLYGCDVEVDFRGYEVTVATFLGVLQGKASSFAPRLRRMESNRDSNVLVFLTGHGGEQFMKFQDAEFISSEDLAASLEVMHAQERFRRMLLIVDTCHAETHCEAIQTPNVACVGSSRTDEESFSHHGDSEIDVQVVDSFTFFTQSFFDSHPITQPPKPSRRPSLWTGFFTCRVRR